MHLKKYNCDNKLYAMVKMAKDELKHQNIFSEEIRIETSVKNHKDGRYTIPVLLTEFKLFSCKIRRKILKYLGFTEDQYLHFIRDKRITTNTDLILGIDNKKGKLCKQF